jgi:hypothetical protein
MRRVIGEEVVEAGPLEDAERHRRQRLHRMLHFPHHRALKTDEIAGHDIVEDLPPAVLQRLVTESPALQNGVKMGAVRAFHQDDGAAFHRKFPRLETRDEIQFGRGKIPEMRQVAQGTLLARGGGNSVRFFWRHEYPSSKKVAPNCFGTTRPNVFGSRWWVKIFSSFKDCVASPRFEHTKAKGLGNLDVRIGSRHFPRHSGLEPESSRRASARREASFQPKDWGWLDSGSRPE